MFKIKEIKNIGIGKKGTLFIQDLIDFLKRKKDFEKCGAIASFIGVVRGYTHNGKKVKKLEVQAFEEMAIKSLKKISEELKERPGIVDVLIHHFVGTFSVKEDLVYVMVAGKSREEVFSTLKEAVERYKHEVALWKKEFLEDGDAYWVSEKI